MGQNRCDECAATISTSFGGIVDICAPLNWGVHYFRSEHYFCEHAALNRDIINVVAEVHMGALCP